MATVDYFAGQKEGNRNLMEALDSYTKETRQTKDDALKKTLMQQQIVAGEDAAEIRKKRRNAEADISAIFSNPEKTPAVEATAGGVATPAVNYTPSEQNERMMDVYKKTGDIDSMAKLQGVQSHQSEEARKVVDMIVSAHMKTGGDINKTKELLKAYNKLGGGKFSDSDIDSITSITQGSNGVIVARDVVDSKGKVVGKTYVDQTGKAAHIKAGDTDANKTDYQSAKGALIDQGNPNPTDTQIRALMQEDKTKVAIASRPPKAVVEKEPDAIQFKRVSDMAAVAEKGGYKANDVEMTQKAANAIGYDYVRYAGKTAKVGPFGGNEEVEWRLIPKSGTQPIEKKVAKKDLTASVKKLSGAKTKEAVIKILTELKAAGYTKEEAAEIESKAKLRF